MKCPLRYILLLALIMTRIASGQGSAADYARANGLRQATSNKVFRQRVAPVWHEGRSTFHYRINTGSGTHHFYFVDAAAGKRMDAFNHSRLPKVLSAFLDTPIAADQLPLRSLKFEPDRSAISFRIQGRALQCQLSDYHITAIDNSTSSDATDVEQLRGPARSRTTGDDVYITFVNRGKQPFVLSWLDNSGEPREYKRLEPRESHEQHTYVGHVWKAVSQNTKETSYYRATKNGTLVVFGQDSPASNNEKSQGTEEATADSDATESKTRVLVRDSNLWLELDGNATALTTDGTTADGYTERILWAPNREAFVAMRRTTGTGRIVKFIESSPPKQLQPVLHEHQYDKPGDRLTQYWPQLFRKSNGNWRAVKVSTELFPEPWSLRDLRWSQDSNRFLFVYNQRGHQVLRYLAIDAESGSVSVLVNEESDTFIDYAGKAFRRYLPETNELIWMSERDGWCHLYLYDATNGKLKNQITRGKWVVRDVVNIDTDRREMLLQVSGIDPDQDPYQIHYIRARFDGPAPGGTGSEDTGSEGTGSRDTGITRLTFGDGSHEIKLSDDGKYFIDTYSRVDMPPVTELRNAVSGKLVCALETADATQLIATGWNAPVRFSTAGRDGRTMIHGVIYLPQDHDPAKSYPVIEKIYAGPHGSFVPKTFTSYRNEQAVAELGFILVQIDGMGTSHRSKAFHDVCWKNLGDSGFPDRKIWIRAAAEQFPSMDLERVGIYGGSAGGQSTVRGLLMHPDFYKVGVADCGCHDNRMDKVWWNELWMGWPIGDHYEEQSNVTQAHRLEGHLLLTVGELDRNVDPASTMQLVNALIDSNKDFDLIVFPGKGHGIGESQYGKRRRRDFFVRHLLNVEPRHE